MMTRKLTEMKSTRPSAGSEGYLDFASADDQSAVNDIEIELLESCVVWLSKWRRTNREDAKSGAIWTAL
jgi:hypothetical protein